MTMIITKVVMTIVVISNRDDRIQQCHNGLSTAQKMKFSIKDFFSKCDQIRSFLRFCLHLLKKSLMESFIKDFFSKCKQL